MIQQSFDHNPEFAYHYERIRKQRAARLGTAYRTLLCAVLCLVVAAYIGFTTSPQTPLATSPILFLIILSIILLIVGIIMLRRGYRPVTSEEVHRRRKAERQELFRYAQGKLPWFYHPIIIAVEVIVSLFPLYFGVTLILSFLSDPSDSSIFATIFAVLSLLLSLLFLIDAFKRAIATRHLRHLSAQELANRLTLGETTEG